MSIFVGLLILSSFLLSAATNLSKFEIDQIDASYSKLLKLPTARNMQDLSDEKIEFKLATVLFMNDINQMFEEVSDPKNEWNNAQEAIFESKLQEFQEVIVNLTDTSSLFVACLMWKFWRNVSEIFVAKNMLSVKRAEFVQNREKLAKNEIDCAQMEENWHKTPKFTSSALDVYLTDTTLAHVNAILYLMMRCRGTEKLQIGNNMSSHQIWQTDQIFDDRRMEHETNLAYQLRIYSTKNREQNRQKILEFKQNLQKLVGQEMAFKVELFNAIQMSPDIMDDNALTIYYKGILSGDAQVSQNHEMDLSMRILYGRIFEIVAKANRLKAKRRRNANLVQIERLWNQKAPEMANAFVKIEQYSLVTAYGTWIALVDLHNRIPNLSSDQKIELVHFEIPKPIKILQIVRDELMEEHVRNIARLYGSQNAFRQMFFNVSPDSLRELKHRARLFFESRYPPESGNGNKMLSNYMKAMGEWYGEHPEIREIIRNVISQEELTRRLINNYIRFFNEKSETDEWKLARIRLNVLAYYKWFLDHLWDPPATDLALRDINMAWMEIWLEMFERYLRPDEAQICGDAFVRIIDRMRKGSIRGYGSLAEYSNPQSIDYGNEPDPITTTVVEMHNDIIGTLLKSSHEFRLMLGMTSLNKERIGQLLGEKSSMIARLINENRGKNLEKNLAEGPSDSKNLIDALVNSQMPSEDTSEMYELVNAYQKFFSESGQIPELDKELLNIDSKYFYQTRMVKKMVDLVATFKNCENRKVKEMAIRIVVESAQAKLLQKLNKNDYDGKRIKVCYMDSFLDRMIKNGLLFTEVPIWRTWMLKRGLVDEKFPPIPSEFDQKWAKPDCENSEFREKTFKNFLFASPLLEANHLLVIEKLCKKLVSFKMFIGQHFLHFPRVTEYVHLAEESRIELYKLMLREDDENLALLTEARLALKPLMSEALDLEGPMRLEMGNELLAIRMELYTTMKIFDLFTPEPLKWRVFCPTMFYIKFLKEKQKRPKILWNISANIKMCMNFAHDQLLGVLRHKLADWHFEYLEDYLANCAEDDQFIDLLDQRTGAYTRLAQLVAGTQKRNPKLVWQSAHKKLIHRDCANNFMNNLKKATSKDSTSKLVKNWLDLEKAANMETEIKWIESGGNFAEPIPMVQKIHFENLEIFFKNGFLENEFVKQFSDLEKVLKESKECRRNLLQLLKLEDIKKFFKLFGIDFVKEEFNSRAIEKSEEIKDDKKSSDLLIKNQENSHQRSITTSEKKKKKKEKKKAKKTSEKLIPEEFDVTPDKQSVPEGTLAESGIVKVPEEHTSSISKKELPEINDIPEKNMDPESKLAESGTLMIPEGIDGLSGWNDEIRSEQGNKESGSGSVKETGSGNVNKEIGSGSEKKETGSMSTSEIGSEIGNTETGLGNEKETGSGNGNKNNGSASNMLKSGTGNVAGSGNGQKSETRMTIGSDQKLTKQSDETDSRTGNGIVGNSGNDPSAIETEFIKEGESDIKVRTYTNNPNQIKPEIKNANGSGNAQNPVENDGTILESISRNESNKAITGIASGTGIEANQIKQESGTASGSGNDQNQTKFVTRTASGSEIDQYQTKIETGTASGSGNDLNDPAKNAVALRKGNNSLNEAEKKWAENEKNQNHEPNQKDGLINLELEKELSKIGSLKDFCSDSVLYSQYTEFFEHHSMINRKILDNGVFVNEIEHQSRILEELNTKIFYFSNKNSNKLLDEWNRLKDELLNMKIENQKILELIEEKLYNILMEFLQFSNNNGLSLSTSITYKKDRQNLKIQLQLQKLAIRILSDPEFGKLWNTDKNSQERKLQYLFDKLINKPQFDEYRTRIEKMLEQIQIDQELYKNKLSTSEQKQFLDPAFPKFSQQIHLMENFNDEQKINTNLLNFLKTIAVHEEHDLRRLNAIEMIKSIVYGWSIGQARLVITGSFMFGTQTIDSDINLICMIPGLKFENRHFFGNENTFCMANKKCSNYEHNLSLFCRLCMHSFVTNLVKITSGTILILQFIFNGIQVDISFVSIPNQEMLALQINDTVLKEYSAKFDMANAEHKKMLRTISSYRSNLYILDQLVDGQGQKIRAFRNMMLALKIWAKNSFIYSNKFGFLNGIVLAIMVTKIILLYPNASTWFLIAKFFLIFTTRPQNLPIQLAKTDLSADPFVVQNYHEQVMPVLTPAFPHQNAARLVTQSSAKTIRKEFTRALNIVKSMNLSDFNWGLLLTSSVPFLQKYDDFMLINCMAVSPVKADQFCQFVEWRLRLQLVFSFDQTSSVETQLYPGIFQRNCKIPGFLYPGGLGSMHCKIWLIGLFASKNVNIMPFMENFDEAIKYEYLRRSFPKIPNSGDIEATFRDLRINLKSFPLKRMQLQEFMIIAGNQK